MGSKPWLHPAPEYRYVESYWDSDEDAPGPRCGHTLTAIAIDSGSGDASGIPGEPPSPRAAHAAAAVGTMVVFQGGIGPAGHSTDDLYVLDLTNDKFKWHRVVVQGQGPGPRYGHVMDLVAQRYLVTVSGNDGDILYRDDGNNESLYSPILHVVIAKETVGNLGIISTLLRPQNWKPPVNRKFFLDSYEVGELCYAAEQIFMQEQTVLQLKAPVKVFGDLHGQFGDLMRLFDEYGFPSTAGDITYIDYLFLGDYVDRGQHSLETITLLLALKASPIQLISRGISCLSHFSSGRIRLKMIVLRGLRPNARGPGLVTFGPDRVTDFCKKNKLQLIIRGHEWVMDGFERFAQGQLITLFCATNYCGMLVVIQVILILPFQIRGVYILADRLNSRIDRIEYLNDLIIKIAQSIKAMYYY
ncbi:hypothetical protein SASPL_123672 [Salvia splendens]|uniref:Serine/threonine specific protein phosphatases domain-containing protein n=1 Tax=Salvia splendens TaxID=180675 RepID=A0A8X8ZTM9_SALSN|nr:hypothetical protein SASPL_123672 [Salvia splendens]